MANYRYYIYFLMFKLSFGKSLQDQEKVIIDEFPTQEFQPQSCSKSKKNSITTSENKKGAKSQSSHPEGNFYKQKAVKQAQQSLTTMRMRDPSIDNESPLCVFQKQQTDSMIEFKSKNMYKRYNKRKIKQNLKDVVSLQKINILKNNFIEKIRRNNIYSPPLTDEEYKHTKEQKIWDLKGIQIPQMLNSLLNSLFIVNIMVMVFISSITIPFAEIRSERTIKILQIVGIVVYACEIILNLLTVRFSLGRKLETMKQISSDYFRQSFYIDLVSLVVGLLNAITDSSVQILIVGKLFIVFKLPDWLKKIKKLEVQFIKNYYKEQYWYLMKVFLFNFLYAHILSIILLCIANLNQTENWMVKRGIEDATWNEKYIWSYYWSTTIMLTIGFGDIVPACYQEACLMIFIETISCIILAYNINCVGTLISNIRLQDEQKHKNLKIFKKLAQKNKVTEQLAWKINNFIQQHSNIKKLTNIEQEANFVESLPSNYKVQYLKESNKNIFKKIFYFNTLMEKTLFALAQNIKAKIAHPLQVLLNNQTNFDLLILKYGEVVCKSNKLRDLKLKNEVFNRVSVKQNDSPFLLHANFITKQRSNFRIISTVYSLIYYLSFDKLIATLKECTLDYQLFCEIKDKSKYHIEEFEVFQCKNCRTRHTLFDCPKYHYIPIKQHVIHKQLELEKAIKNQRKSDFRRQRINKEIFLVTMQSHRTIVSNKSNSEIRKKLEQSKKNGVWKNKIQLDPYLQKSRKARAIQLYNNQQIVLYEELAQTLKVHLSKIIGCDEGKDQVWLVQSDKMNNFKKYFTHDNPQKLEEKSNARKKKLRTNSENSKAEQVQLGQSIMSIQETQKFTSKSYMATIKSLQRSNDSQIFTHKFIGKGQCAKKTSFTILISNPHQLEMLSRKYY